MRGIVDRVARAADGAVEIHDYKTGQRVPPQRVLDTDRQLALYQIAVAERHGAATEYRLVWHYLASGQTRVSRRSAEQLDTLRRETMGLIDAIHAEAAFEPRPGPLCAWCEYNARCPAAGGAAGVAASDPIAAPPPPPGQISLL
jgi:putative RecB family exonuclease